MFAPKIVVALLAAIFGLVAAQNVQLARGGGVPLSRACGHRCTDDGIEIDRCPTDSLGDVLLFCVNQRTFGFRTFDGELIVEGTCAGPICCTSSQVYNKETGECEERSTEAPATTITLPPTTSTTMTTASPTTATAMAGKETEEGARLALIALRIENSRFVTAQRNALREHEEKVADILNGTSRP